MIFMVFLPLLWHVISGHLYNLECGSEEVPDFTIEPSDDGVLGRYLVQWCTQLTNPTIEKWTFFLYARNVSIKDCEFYKITDKQYIHSRIEQKINKTLECSGKACISTYLDLVYTGCYTLRSEFYLANNQRKYDYRLRYIVSGLNSLDDINNMKSVFVTESLGENIMLKVDSLIPLTDYYVKLCSDEACSYIERGCAARRAGRRLWAARCLAPPPHTGPSSGTKAVRLAALLSHAAPWAHGVMFRPHIKDIYLNFSYYPGAAGGAGGGGGPGASGALVWVCAGAGALALLALAAALRGLLRAPHRYNTMKSNPTEASPAKLSAVSTRGAGGASGAGGVLVLVYSRDVPVFMRAAHSLSQTLVDNHVGRVVTLYSASTAAECGGSGAEWLRGLLARGARVLVLQTPALLASTTPHAVLGCGGAGGGGSPAGAQFGDTLVAAALRAARHHHHHSAYRTYYVATLSPSPCEVVPLVCPYRRYELPEALPTLLDHLTPGGVTNEESMLKAMQDMSTYLEFVRENPGYLQDLASP